ncbi:MAG: LysM peptidoglycan-binding domain-containing protein [Bacteroidota bacterium]
MKLRIMEDARKEIQEDVDKLTRSPVYFNKQVEKAKSYFPIVERVFSEERLPDDFKYLALQESGLISDAVSSSNAVGFWQFKDFTAMEVGLRVDKQVDERMNIVSASRGAARYLKKNNNSFFDNWLMSLQAYQMGPGTALKVGADKHRGEKSMTINKKTYWYVKKYLAHKIAYEDAVQGKPRISLIEHRALPNESLNDIAKLYRVDSEEVVRYNKWLRKGKIPNDKEYIVIVPTENAVQRPIVTSTKSSNPVKPNTTIDYDLADPAGFPAIKDESLAKKGEMVEINGLPGILARKGDKIPEIAALGNLELSKFLKYNDLEIDDQLIEGQVYYLKPKRSKGKARYHVAAEGESLWDVSQKYGVKLKKLYTKNRMKSGKELKAGRVIWLRYIRPAKVPVEYKELGKLPYNTHGSQENIVADKTSDKEGLAGDVKPADLVEVNQVSSNMAEPLTFLQKLDSLERLEKALVKTDPKVDSVNISSPLTTTIKRPASVKEEYNSDSVVHIHNVSAGDTFYAISKKYQVNVLDLLKWNELSINDKLSVNQKIKVYNRKMEDTAKQLIPKTEQNADSTYIDYEVKEGDTLYSIARKNGVKVEDLLDWNKKNDASIKLGEVLKIKKPTSD